MMTRYPELEHLLNLQFQPIVNEHPQQEKGGNHHQDAAFNTMDARCPIVWLAVKDADVENGCMWFVDGEAVPGCGELGGAMLRRGHPRILEPAPAPSGFEVVSVSRLPSGMEHRQFRFRVLARDGMAAGERRQSILLVICNTGSSGAREHPDPRVGFVKNCLFQVVRRSLFRSVSLWFSSDCGPRTGRWLSAFA